MIKELNDEKRCVREAIIVALAETINKAENLRGVLLY